MLNLRGARLFLSLGLLSGAVWAGTSATFTDSGTAETTFTTGTVDIVMNGGNDDAYAFTSLQMSDMKPGDVKYAPLTVANGGSLGLSYTMATSATNADSKALRDQLVLGVKKVTDATKCDSAGVGYDASVDTVVTSGALSAAAIPIRALAASSVEVLCFKVQLATSAGDSYQGATTTVTFTFTASQS